LRDKLFIIKFIYFSLSVISLVLGVMIYAGYRNTDILLYNWIAKPKFIEMFYKPMVTESSIVNSIFVYNVPDGLWFLSGILLTRSIWLTKLTTFNLYMLIFSLIAFILEFSQLNKNIRGTFDILDLLFMSLGIFAEFTIYTLFIRRRIL
jgi:hypothetical protein